ncbi:hypothetical protein [Brunnivagina elsteri]|uniref:Filamentous hemagglutinin n=1 Tax=Brunnivagina elsteri CCALA 953 TaxID=987040 RepID=A0A2A2TND1_9CYAN|nr:hypothetical protein [Calothrix elsteri]PAX59628.1 hypothetical protein CK510_06090 [Calothrix elsteri CCALA 953]
MLKKSLALGVLAAFAMAPAAFANQVQGNVSNTNITSGNFGVGNVSGISNHTNTDQYQGKYINPYCVTGKQIQGNAGNTGIVANNVGYGNVTGISNGTNASQSQYASGCSY